MSPLILKRGDPSRRRDNDYDVLEDGKVVGRIFTVPVAASSAAAIFRQCAATSSQCFLSNEFAALSARFWLSSACFRNSSAFDAMGKPQERSMEQDDANLITSSPTVNGTRWLFPNAHKEGGPRCSPIWRRMTPLRRWRRSPRAGAEGRDSRLLARSSSSRSRYFCLSECPVCPMSVNLTQYRIG